MATGRDQRRLWRVAGKDERMNKFIEWLGAKVIAMAMLALAAGYLGFLMALFWRCFMLGWDILQ